MYYLFSSFLEESTVTKKTRFITLVMGVVAMLATNALAVTITVNGITTFDSGGLENATPSPIVGSYPK